MKDEYPDPRQVVARTRENAEGMGEGVVHDTVMEAKIDAEDYHHKVSDMVAALDAVADNQGLLPEEVQAEVTNLHQEMCELEEWMAALTAAFEKELDELQRR